MTNSLESAETAKVIENIQRDLNIAFINDILIFADKMNYDFEEIFTISIIKMEFLEIQTRLSWWSLFTHRSTLFKSYRNLNKIKLKTLLAGRT